MLWLVGSADGFSLLRGEKNHCLNADNTIIIQCMVIPPANNFPNASNEQYVVTWEE